MKTSFCRKLMVSFSSVTALPQMFKILALALLIYDHVTTDGSITNNFSSFVPPKNCACKLVILFRSAQVAQNFNLLFSDRLLTCTWMKAASPAKRNPSRSLFATSQALQVTEVKPQERILSLWEHWFDAEVARSVTSINHHFCVVA